MWILLLGLTSGFLATSCSMIGQEVRLRGCSFVGVFLIQGRQRYSLEQKEAQPSCEGLGATLASEDQINASYVSGMQTCRYGWTSHGTIAILRHEANQHCAGNLTGYIVMNTTESRFDAYCYDPKDLSVKNCTLAFNLDLKPGSSPAPLPTAGTENPRGTTLDPDNPTMETYTANMTLMETTEADSNGEGPATESHSWPPRSVESTAWTTSLVTRLDSGGSGMEEPSTKETSDISSEDDPHYPNVTDTPDAPGIEPTELGADMDPPAKDKGKSEVADWLIIVCVVLAVAVILLFCFAVATRKRWCGRQQTLMITSKSSSEGNGAATSVAGYQAQEREQEMVTLMNKEKIQENGNTEEFTAITLEESPEKKDQA